jgi:hypothetical protein
VARAMYRHRKKKEKEIHRPPVKAEKPTENTFSFEILY